jgi:hypothetical protein
MSHEAGEAPDGFQAPHPGARAMPRWNAAELIDAPHFTWRKWFALLGPGLLMAGAAIGGGEWLVGPQVTARYGGALLWLAALSILGQVVYNLEISRYALYTGEPIFTGKFRTLPGPLFWVLLYLLLDIGAVFPYLASSAATPVAMLVLGRMPDTASTKSTVDLFGLGLVHVTENALLRGLGYVIFLLALAPLVFGGKIYNSLKAVMTFKIVGVLGFLTVLGLLYSSPVSWWELASGFFKFGNLPVHRAEDRNGNGALDPGEDWDGDGKLDGVEAKFSPPVTDRQGRKVLWSDPDGNGRPDAVVDTDGDGEPDAPADLPSEAVPAGGWLDRNGDGQPDRFDDVDGDGIRDGDNIENVFVNWWRGEALPALDWTVLGLLCQMVAIAGLGGLSNTPISNYTRDQGWGMGHHVGAIPSVIGGRHLKLSHVGSVFEPTAAALVRWRRWVRHVLRDQLVVFMPACFIGLALPSMLSLEFLPKGTEAASWTSAGMTAGGVYARVEDPSAFVAASNGTNPLLAARNRLVEGWAGPRMAGFVWFLTLFAGFLTLAPTMSASADGTIRRWVDVFWTSSRTLRSVDPGHIRTVYFTVLCGYALFGVLVLVFVPLNELLRVASVIFNYAFGFSCWHTLAVNLALLPPPLRPGWLVRIALFLTGAFFMMVAGLSTYVAIAG